MINVFENDARGEGGVLDLVKKMNSDQNEGRRDTRNVQKVTGGK